MPLLAQFLGYIFTATLEYFVTKFVAKMAVFTAYIAFCGVIYIAVFTALSTALYALQVSLPPVIAVGATWVLSPSMINLISVRFTVEAAVVVLKIKAALMQQYWTAAV